MEKPIITKDQWDKKWLRDGLWMPFGSMCNIIAQSYQGKEIKGEDFEKVCDKAFEKALQYTRFVYNRGEEINKEVNLDIPNEKGQNKVE